MYTIQWWIYQGVHKGATLVSFGKQAYQRGGGLIHSTFMLRNLGQHYSHVAAIV